MQTYNIDLTVMVAVNYTETCLYKNTVHRLRRVNQADYTNKSLCNLLNFNYAYAPAVFDGDLPKCYRREILAKWE